MKVIGLTGSDYIAVVSHSEIEKLANKYYGNLPRLVVGADFDLGSGYDFHQQIKSVCSEMTSAMQRLESARGTLTRFAALVAERPDSEAQNAVQAAAGGITQTAMER